MFAHAVLNVKFKTHRSIILPVVYFVMWVRNLVRHIKRKFRPTVFQNRTFSGTFGPKKDELGGGCRKLTFKKFSDLIYLPFELTNGSCRI